MIKRATLLAMTTITLGLMIGCGGPPEGKINEFFASAMHHHFNKLNTDAELRNELLSAERTAHSENPTLPPPTGVQFNTFRFDETGVVIYEYPCEECAYVYPALDYIGHKMRCVHCGEVLIDDKPEGTGDVISWLKTNHDADAVPMFQPEGSGKLPAKATIRYIRRSWVYDPLGTVDIDVSTIPESTRIELDTNYIPGSGSKVGVGFHRLDAVFIGEQEFEYDGSSVEELTRAKEKAVRRLREIRPIFLQSGR
ncbi:MAG: hypothetical protein QF645_05055 [Planctomycetota bacterium]|jgi:hypothetical protein|nr:hypothetical protein [Planctomycetota bacterium]